VITEGIREEVDKTVCLLTHSTPFYVFMNKRVSNIDKVIFFFSTFRFVLRSVCFKWRSFIIIIIIIIILIIIIVSSSGIYFVPG
jgi:hypothetical protein